MKKIVFCILIGFIFGFLFIWLIYDSNSWQIKVDENIDILLKSDAYLMEGIRPYSDSVVCTLKISSALIFEDDNLTGNLGIDENPMALTFIDLNSDNPSMIGNYGDRVPLTKISEGEQLYLVETTSIGNFNVFTLFRDKNIMLMSKQYELLGMPFGLIMIGDCRAGL